MRSFIFGATLLGLTTNGACANDTTRSPQNVIDEQACGSRGMAECPAGTYCSFSLEVQCGVADHPGVCEPYDPSDPCPAVIEPVCGCDGNTYQNECDAARKGMAIRNAGACTGPEDCSDQELAVGCEESGCRWLVPGCDQPALPVEGCFSKIDCEVDENCGVGYFCKKYSVNPCSEGLCEACGQETGVCVLLD